jgi:hypothetical protein
MNVLGMRASSWSKHVPLEERVGQLNNGTQGINNVKNIEGALPRGVNSMEMEISKEGMSGPGCLNWIQTYLIGGLKPIHALNG